MQRITFDRARVAVLASSLLAVAACSSDEPATCGAAGTTQACLCAGGAAGTQSCLASGAWGTCACGATQDALGGDVDAVDAGDTAISSGLAVISRTPAEDATDVAPNVVITVTFDAPLAPTPAASWATLREGDASVAVGLSVQGSELRITPQAPLRTEATYTVALTTDVAAADGTKLGASASWSFTTAGPVRVVSVTPTDGATAVPIGSGIEITFSKPLASHGSIVVEPPAAFNLILENETAMSLSLLPGTPPALREYATTYEIRLTGDFRATDGAPLEPWDGASFSTVFLDDGYYYKLHVERDDELTALDNFADGQRYAYMTTANTNGSHWWFKREGDWLLLGSDFGGDNLLLRAQAGSESARLTPGGFDDEQRWRFVKYNPRTGVQRPAGAPTTTTSSPRPRGPTARSAPRGTRPPGSTRCSCKTRAPTSGTSGGSRATVRAPSERNGEPNACMSMHAFTPPAVRRSRSPSLPLPVGGPCRRQDQLRAARGVVVAAEDRALADAQVVGGVVLEPDGGADRSR